MFQKLKYFPFVPLVILVAVTIRLFVSGLTWLGVIVLAASGLWFAFELIRWMMIGRQVVRIPHHRTPLKQDAQESLVSLAYFLSEPRTVTEESIRTCVMNALGVVFDLANPEAEYFITEFVPPPEQGQPPGDVQHFMVRIPQGLFSVLVAPTPYISDPKEFAAKSIRDKRLRNAVETHSAWLSVDLMDPVVEAAESRIAYSVIGKILASMAGPDCLAVFCPEMQRCNEFDFTLIEDLNSANPLRIFDEPTFEPIIEVSDSNPRMKAAVREALDRWPEFVDAFAKCDEDEKERFIIKAEFSEGKKREYMWVTVDSIEDDTIYGVLINDPHELMNVYRGSDVVISHDRLNDWIFPGTGGDPVGGFTLEVLADEE